QRIVIGVFRDPGDRVRTGAFSLRRGDRDRTNAWGEVGNLVRHIHLAHNWGGLPGVAGQDQAILEESRRWRINVGEAQGIAWRRPGGPTAILRLADVAAAGGDLQGCVLGQGAEELHLAEPRRLGGVEYG